MSLPRRRAGESPPFTFLTVAGCAFVAPLGIFLYLDSLFSQAQAVYSQGVVVLATSTASVLLTSPAVFFLASMPSVACLPAHFLMVCHHLLQGLLWLLLFPGTRVSCVQLCSGHRVLTFG